ncbi:MAG: hypothetical protein QNJ54_19795 [Prochloraceae cyanobacterium]|nr:hypothetical protein [Prochloraceae cyanobacterium]
MKKISNLNYHKFAIVIREFILLHLDLYALPTSPRSKTLTDFPQVRVEIETVERRSRWALVGFGRKTKHHRRGSKLPSPM